MGEAFVHVVEFILKCIFVYPFTLTWKAIQAMKERIPDPPPNIPVKDRPATPTETKSASVQIQLAHRFFVQALENENSPDTATRSLTFASKALNEARALDPTAEAVVEHRKEEKTYNVDQLSSEILYAQSVILMNAGHALLSKIIGNDDPSDMSEKTKQMKRYYRDALEAAKTAVAYQPKSVKYRLLLAKAYGRNEYKSDSLRELREAERLDPHDLDVLQYKAEIQ